MRLTRQQVSPFSLIDSLSRFREPDHEPNEGNDVEPNDIDLKAARAERIAFATSAEPGRARWTELAVYYLHEPPRSGRRWLSESIGRSTLSGETDRMRRLNVGSLDRALNLFTDSDMGVVVSEQARDWEETETGRQTYAHAEAIFSEARTSAATRLSDLGDTGIQQKITDLLSSGDNVPAEAMARLGIHPPVPDSDADALAWLYGEPDGGKATFASMLARDFDLAPRTVTTALKEGTPIRVPLRAVLRFFDRDAFRAWRKERSDG